MIASSLAQKNRSWQQILAEGVKDIDELWQILKLDPASKPQYPSTTFPLRVPRGFVARMQPGNRQDPLLLQILPELQELQTSPGYQLDPLQESEANPVPGVIHKYHGRMLVTLTGACAIHCRYCFRRHFPYNENNPRKNASAEVLNYLENHPDIEEVILSGGDPLTLSDDHLQNFVDNLEKIKHVTRLRIHSRLPIVLPERMTQQLIDIFANSRFQVVLVTHCNHPNELNQEVAKPLQYAASRKITLLNQAVLLKKINDNAETLIKLNKRLFEYQILPYYLHVLDKVQGSAHFDIEEEHAHQLWQQLLAHLPGYLVPRLVREQPVGGASKQWLARRA